MQISLRSQDKQWPKHLKRSYLREEEKKGLKNLQWPPSGKLFLPRLVFKTEAALQWMARVSFMSLEIPAMHFLKNSVECMLRF